MHIIKRNRYEDEIIVNNSKEQGLKCGCRLVDDGIRDFSSAPENFVVVVVVVVAEEIILWTCKKNAKEPQSHDSENHSNFI